MKTFTGYKNFISEVFLSSPVRHLSNSTKIDKIQ